MAVDNDYQRVIEAKATLDEINPGDYPSDLAILIDKMQEGLDDLAVELQDHDDVN
jgi:hypothetical protein